MINISFGCLILLLANEWPYQLIAVLIFEFPFNKPIPTPASVRGGPVAYLGGPVAYLGPVRGGPVAYLGGGSSMYWEPAVMHWKS